MSMFDLSYSRYWKICYIIFKMLSMTFNYFRILKGNKQKERKAIKINKVIAWVYILHFTFGGQARK